MRISDWSSDVCSSDLVPFVSVENMMDLVIEIGTDTFLRELATYVEEDFRRWEHFDKTPRIASHSAEGVIELMPTRSEERRVGKECVSTCRSRCSPDH